MRARPQRSPGNGDRDDATGVLYGGDRHHIFPDNPHGDTCSVSSPSGPVAGQGCRMRGSDPDPACTPGARNTAVTQDSIGTTICTYGYTRRIRPPVAESNRLKREAAQMYGITDSLSNYEGDHLIALELGGAPDDISNFWDQPHAGVPGTSSDKDGFENFLHRQVCDGTLSLATAQREIATDWYGSWVAAARPRG